MIFSRVVFEVEKSTEKLNIIPIDIFDNFRLRFIIDISITIISSQLPSTV